MKTTQEYIQLLKEHKQARGMLYGISSIGIFGSVARGEQTEDSDVDVIRIRQHMDALLKRDIMEEGIYV